MKLPNLQNLVNEVVHDLSLLPYPLPPGWAREANTGFRRGAAAFTHLNGLRVLVSLSLMEDGSKWDHLSVTYCGGPPSWTDIMRVKGMFFGEETECLQVIPKMSDEINIAHCWHIWREREKEAPVSPLHRLVSVEGRFELDE